MTLEHEGDPQCRHEWVRDSLVIDTYPETYHRICKLCGRVEHERDSLPIETETFGSIYHRFYFYEEVK